MARNTVAQPKQGELFRRRFLRSAARLDGFSCRSAHADYRRRVSLNDYRTARAERIDIPYGCTDAARLMGAPVDLPRADARSLCGMSDKTLAVRAAKFLTLADEYAKRRTFWRVYLCPPANVYPAWAKPNHQGKPQPFESGFNCLPGMESFAEQIRQAA